MKTEFEIASIISNYINSNNGVTDFPVSLSQIADEVDTLRVRVIEDLDSKGVFRRPYFNYTQTIDFTSTKKDATNNRYVDVPRLVFSGDGVPLIAYAGASNGMKDFRKVYGLQAEQFRNDQWIGKAPTVIITDNGAGYRLSFKNVSPTSFKIVAIFQDPSDLEPFGYNGWEDAANGGSSYPMSSGQIDAVIGKTVESYVRTMYRIKPQGNQTVDDPNAQKIQTT